MDRKLYGVSSGDGNNGVSHSFPGYYVLTDNPWLLAHAALIDRYNTFTRDGRRWRRAAAEATIDGEAGYTIYATMFEGPDGETAFGAAVAIVEVFPVEPDDVRKGTMAYRSISAALQRSSIRMAKRHGS